MMAPQMVGDAPPALRHASASAADLAASAARGAGPLARTRDEVTEGARLRLADSNEARCGVSPALAGRSYDRPGSATPR